MCRRIFLYNFSRESLLLINIKTIFLLQNRSSNLLRFKDTIPSELGFHVIYKFLCNICKITYYSGIECHIKVRSGERLKFSPLIGKEPIIIRGQQLKITFFVATCKQSTMIFQFLVTKPIDFKDLNVLTTII